MKNIFVVILAVFLSACAGTEIYEQYSDEELGDNGGATLYVFRPSKFAGSIIYTSIYVNDKKVAKIGFGGHLKLKIPTGNVKVAVTTSYIDLTVTPGKSYYAEVTMPPQLWLVTPSFDIKVLGEKQGEILLKEHDGKI